MGRALVSEGGTSQRIESENHARKEAAHKGIPGTIGVDEAVSWDLLSWDLVPLFATRATIRAG